MRPRPPSPTTPTPDPLGQAIDTAIAGQPRALYAFLARSSGLPGVRANAGIVLAFASHCATRGKRADALARTMATLDADRAPGGTEREILPMCGVAALGARAATDAKAYAPCLSVLEAAAEDLRFRVRDEVPIALSRIGAVKGEALLEDVGGWMDGLFQSAAVLIAVSDNRWLSLIKTHETLVARMDQAFELVRTADRATERYPGYKALVEALSNTTGIFAARFGAPVFDRMVAWSTVKEPKLRDAITRSLAGTRLGKRFGSDVARVERALADSAPVRRDPRSDVGPTRRRGKGSRR
jgi:hypothetical protein